METPPPWSNTSIYKDAHLCMKNNDKSAQLKFLIDFYSIVKYENYHNESWIYLVHHKNGWVGIFVLNIGFLPIGDMQSSFFIPEENCTFEINDHQTIILYSWWKKIYFHLDVSSQTFQVSTDEVMQSKQKFTQSIHNIL